MVHFLSSSGSITIEPSPANFRYWTFKNARHVEQVPGHLVIECAQPCYVISPSLSDSLVQPTEQPYVRVHFDPGSSIYEPRILLSNRQAPDKFSPRPAMQEPDHLLSDLRARRQWNSELPYEDALDRVGFSFTGRVLLNRIEVAGAVNLHDYGLLLYRDFTSVEPAAPSAINEFFGVHILGRSLTVVAIGSLVIAISAIASFARTNHLRKMSFALASVMLFLYIPASIYLLEQAKIAAAHSCLKRDSYSEQASCYGREFADLSKSMSEMIPRGSKVHFIRQIIDTYKTEANFAEFVHRTNYDPQAFGDAEYYVSLSWPGIYDQATQNLMDPFTHQIVKVEPVYRLGNSIIARAKR